AEPGGPADALARIEHPVVSFNYLGQWDNSQTAGVFAQLGGISLGQSPEQHRPHLLDIVASVRDGELTFVWVYSTNLHHESTVRGLADGLVGVLAELVGHCLGEGAGGCTPSDFPFSGLDQVGVDEVVGDGRGVEDVYRLTPMQAGMLFHSLAVPD